MVAFAALVPLIAAGVSAARSASSKINMGRNSGIMNLLSGLNFSGNESESETRWDPYASIAQSALQSAQWRGETQWYNDNIVAHSYRRARESLQEAGYNPLMALQYGGLYDQAPTNSASISQSSARESSISGGLTKLTDSQNANTWADTDLKNSQSALTTAQTSSEYVKQMGYFIDNQIKKADKIIADVKAKYADKKEAEEIKKIMSETKRNLAEGESALSNAYARKLEGDARMMDAKTNQIVGASTEYKNYHPNTTNSGHIGPSGISFSRTGPSIIGGKKTVVKEKINGKWVPVTVYN